MIQVFGDQLLVELPKQDWATADEAGEQDDPRAGTGTVIAIPDEQDILYLGSFNWAFDESFLSKDIAKDIRAVMERLKGKRIYWERHADKGLTIEDGDKKYAIIKLSKVIAVDV